MTTIISGDKEYVIDVQGSAIKVNGAEIDIDYCAVSEEELHFIYQGKSYRVSLVSLKGKSGVLRLNEKEVSVLMRNPKEKILEKIGISADAEARLDDLQAPMPGKILKVLKSPGEKIVKGEGLLVLEAMKMENVLKASADSVISNVIVQEGDAVEKNQILITFE